MYKLFPAMAGGPTYLETARAWTSVYKDLVIVYTGGVNAENIPEIVRRDPKGIICGSALLRHAGDKARLKEEAERWLSAIHEDQPEGEQEEVQNETPEEVSAMPAQEKTDLKSVAAPKTAEKVEKAKKADKAEKAEKAAEGQAPVERDVVVTFGEILLRLSPPMGLRFGQTTNFDATFGGSEANVAVALANYGLKSRYVTALPEHAIGQTAVNSLRTFGVDTRYILRQGDRVGVYYLEHGASQRPSRVIYDRKGSSMSEIVPNQVDWDSVFQGVRWFHWSGITPALSDSAAEATMEALKAAKRAGAIVSVDINYRSQLWGKEKSQEIMVPMMLYVDLAIGNEEDVSMVFDIKPSKSDPSKGEIHIEDYEEVTKEMVSRMGFKMAAITLRESHTASDNVWSACLFDGDNFHHSKQYPIHIVDRVGGGDAFTAGLIYSLISRRSPKECLEFAVAASCLKQTIQGDFNMVTAQEVELLAAGNSTGRIVR
jgi:2-dehydro-3-deoxygluconokinase